MDLVTRDLDVCRINAVVESLRQDLELVEVRKSLEFAEIRARLQDAQMDHEASPECAKESFRTSRSQERSEMVGAGDAA